MKKILGRKKAFKRIRSLSEGNPLWRHFRELGQSRYDEFLQLLACNKIPLSTFYSDTYPDKDLGAIPFRRIRVYQTFFTDLNPEEGLPIAKPASLVERERKRDKATQLATRLGLNR